MSLLSWDDIEEKPSNEVLLERAKAGIENLDTTEAVAELEAQRVAVTKPKTDFKLLGSSELMKKAMANVEQMKISMDAEGRVDVSDKFLLNCRADLNQLVPFKYDWSWLLYLSSCDHHWMPGELGMYKDTEAVNSSISPDLNYSIVRLYLNCRYREHDYRESTLLACYRLITNPEARQYILRQAFESTMIHHAMDDFNSYFNPLKRTSVIDYSRDLWTKDKFKYIDRSKLISDLIKDIKDDTFITTGKENTHKFITNLIYLYGYVNWIIHIVPMYQMLKAQSQQGIGNSIRMLCERMIRDIRSQTMFSQLFIKTALEENPGYSEGSAVNDQFIELINRELSFLDSFSIDNQDNIDCKALLEYFSKDFLTECGIATTIKVTPLSKTAEEFVKLVNASSTDTNQQASVTGNTGSGGSLDWN